MSTAFISSVNHAIFGQIEAQVMAMAAPRKKQTPAEIQCANGKKVSIVMVS